MLRMAGEDIIYGGSLSYRYVSNQAFSFSALTTADNVGMPRHMCRFNSGFIHNQEVMRKYDWYWRVEPGIQFYCDVD